MTKKVVPLFALITLAACLFSYKLGSAPTALAKAPAPQEMSDQAAPQTLPTAPATWTLTAQGGGTKVATLTRPAGGSGVKHVATCIAFSENSVGTTYADFGVALRDGPSQTGTVIWQYAVTAEPGVSIDHSICDLNIVGSANTAMTLEMSGDTQFVGESVNLVGYDAQ